MFRDTVPANGVVNLSVPFNIAPAGSNVPCGGDVYCSGQRKDHSLNCPTSMGPYYGQQVVKRLAPKAGPPWTPLELDVYFDPTTPPTPLSGFPNVWQVQVVVGVTPLRRSE